MGPPELDCEWQDNGIDGMRRFLHRCWQYLTTADRLVEQQDAAVTRRFHRFLQTYQERLQLFKPNTAIAAFMELINDLTAQNAHLNRATAEQLLVSLSVLAPHISAELLEKLLSKELADCRWPIANPLLAMAETVTVAIQINGKLRSTLQIAPGTPQQEVESLAKAASSKWLEGLSIVKIVYVPDKLVSIVAR